MGQGKGPPLSSALSLGGDEDSGYLLSLPKPSCPDSCRLVSDGGGEGGGRISAGLGKSFLHMFLPCLPHASCLHRASSPASLLPLPKLAES